MTTLKLVNNTGLISERNLCYINTELQLLYSIPEVTEFFVSKKYRETCTQKLPICDEISRIFGTRGQFPTSAAELRRLVGTLHGRRDICDGAQQDLLEFHTLLLTSIEDELATVGYRALSFLIKFKGKERTKKVFLHTRDGCCTKGHSVRTDEVEFQVIKIDVPSTIRKLSLNNLVNNKFGERTETLYMKCSDCCQHPSNCPQNGPCKLAAASSKTELVSTPDLLFIQLLRFRDYQQSKIETEIIPENILVLPNNDKYKLVSIGNHLGTFINNGHYQAVVKHGTTWFNADDSHITRTSWMNEITGYNYILVYRKFSTQKPFIATDDWEEVLEGQPIPPGLRVQLDLQSGKKYAKLDNSQSSKQSKVNNSKTGQSEQKSKKMPGKNETTAKKEESKNSKTIPGEESNGLGKRKLESSHNNKDEFKKFGPKTKSSSPYDKELSIT